VYLVNNKGGAMEISEFVLFGSGVWVVCFILALVVPSMTGQGRLPLVKAAEWASALCLFLALLGLGVSGVQYAFEANVSGFGQSLGVLAAGVVAVFLLQITGKSPHAFS